MEVTKEAEIYRDYRCISIIEHMFRITSLVKSIILLDIIFRWSNPNFHLKDKQSLIKRIFFEDTQIKNLYHEYLIHEIELLLPILKKCNGDVTFVDKTGRTIMHLWILHYLKGRYSPKKKKRDAELMKNLMSMGASPIASDHNGDTPLGMALAKKRLDLVSLILRDCHLHGYTVLGETVLHILIDKYIFDNFESYKRYLELIRLEYIDRMIDWGYREATTNVSDENGVTPVHLAAKHLYIEALMMFENYGGIIKHIKTKSGDSTLIIACKNLTMKSDSDLLRAIEWLLNRGCDVNLKNRNGFTSLHYASRSCELSVIRALETAGANLNAIADDGTNPLFSASMMSNFEVLFHLIERGVAFDIRDRVYGFTLMHAAALNRDERIIDWFIENGFEPNDSAKYGVTPLHLACLVGNAKIVQKLIKRGANVLCRDKTWHCTPLHLASMTGEFLTIEDFYPGRKFSKSNTAYSLIDHFLSFLRFKTDTEADYNSIIVILLNAGIDVNANDNRGRTPLHYAAQNSSDSSIVEVLLTAGAHLDSQDKQGFTPFHNILLNDKKLQYLLIFGADINDIEHCNQNIFYKIKSRNSRVMKDILDHSVKLKIANLPLSSIYKIFVDNKKLHDLHETYSKEITKMKYLELATNISLYDILHLSYNRRLNFIKNLPSDLQNEFPHYYPVIRGSCYAAINRKNLLEPAKIAYQLITGLHWPDLCIEHIFSFLNNKTLRALVDSIKTIE